MARFCSILGLTVLPLLPSAEQHNGLALVQKQVAFKQRTDGLGSIAPLTEEGYQEVAALKNNREMKAFAHRLMQSEARYISNAGELTGAIHWYSGRMDVQNLETLKKELRQAWWTKAGEGKTAPLNEKGYQAVAAMKSNAHMRAFMRRILDKKNKKVIDPGAFDAMAPYYDGEIAVQSFDRLQQELLSAEWAVRAEDAGDAEANLENLATEVVDEMLVQEEDQSLKDQSLGSTAPLNQEGYEKVAALVSNKEMKKFAFRILQSEARWVSNLGGLAGAVPWYSGRKQVQDYESLKSELRRSWWTKVGEGRTAPLNERGFQAVSAMKSNAHMRAFMRRILNAANKKVTDEDAFDAVAPYYDGEYRSIDEQSFERLQIELLAAPWVVDVDKDTEIEKSEGFGNEVVDEMFMEVGGIVDGPKNKHGAACSDWCENEMFATVVENNTMSKNLSSWEMKCSWYYCGGCTACKDPSLRVKERRDHKREKNHVFDPKDASCDDWCSSEEFMYTRLNKTITGHFTWEMKCGWQYCASCGKCGDKK